MALAGAIACTTRAKETAARAALDAMSSSERRESVEATARMLDERPDLVDEVYAVIRTHPPLLERFFENASKDLAHRPMAELAARHLVANPPALEQTMTTNLELVAPNPPARAAMNRALAERAELATDVVTDSPHAVERLLEATLNTLERKPLARQATVLAVRRKRGQVLAFLKKEPELAKDLGKAVLREAVKDKPAVEKALRGAKILDDER